MLLQSKRKETDERLKDLMVVNRLRQNYQMKVSG